jgi:hypothetical protein
MIEISSLSTIYVKVPITAKKDGADFDPSGDIVRMAFVPEDTNPVVGDWKSASWEATGWGNGAVFARCLIGPAGVATLTPGIKDVWVDVADSPEHPSARAGKVLVT